MTDHPEPKPSLVERLQRRWHQDACDLDPEGTQPFDDIAPEFHAAAAEITRRQLRELAAYLRETPEELVHELAHCICNQIGVRRDWKLVKAIARDAVAVIADHLEKEAGNG